MKYRTQHRGDCPTCNGPVIGTLRRKFCSRKCRNTNTNLRHQAYQEQQARGRERKLKMIEIMGGACARCGYRRNYAALEFHHVKPGSKSFQLDLRSLSNRNWVAILEEAAKCEMLCGNCHAELHHPDCGLACREMTEIYSSAKRLYSSTTVTSPSGVRRVYCCRRGRPVTGSSHSRMLPASTPSSFRS
jgi:hypothetical protein